MNYLFDFGELLICFAPAFVIIAAVGLLLLKNSWPPQDRNSPMTKPKTNRPKNDIGGTEILICIVPVVRGFLEIR